MSTTTVELGHMGARARWGPRRQHNVADLAPERRERIEAFIEAERRAQEREQQHRQSVPA